jgi:polyhydroxybutyrate depolymerase
MTGGSDRSRRAAVPVLLALALALGGAACGDDGGSGDAAATTSARPPDCSPARPARSGLDQAGSMRFEGLERPYRISVPAGYDGRHAAPLLLNLHGFGGNGRVQDSSTGMPAAATRRGYVVVAPDGGPLKVPLGLVPEGQDAKQFDGMPFWNFFAPGRVDFGPGGQQLDVDSSIIGANDTAFLAALISRLERDLCIDGNRIYATGMSNGAGMTTTLGCEIGDRLAAIAPVSGVNLSGRCRGDAPVPVLAIHGEADHTAEFQGNGLLGFQLGNPSVPQRMAAWAEHNGCRGDPEVAHPGTGLTVTRWRSCRADVVLETIAGWGHQWPRAATPDAAGVIDATRVVLDFFDAHRRR